MRGGRDIVLGPRLRGTGAARYAKFTYKPATLQNQVDALRRKVNQQKPETQYWLDTKRVVTTVASGYEEATYTLTQLFIANTNFRSQVLGDRWQNVMLRLNLAAFFQNITQARIIVYAAKKPATTMTFTDVLGIPDPNAFTIFWDEFILADHATQKKEIKRMIPLNVQTLYNTDTAVLERGDIKMLLMLQSSSSSQTAFEYRSMLKFHNK